MKRRLLTAAAACTVVVFATTVPAWAHGNMPPYIAFWGPFSEAATRCQRMLGLAAQRCVGEVLALPRTCPDCDAAELSAARETAIMAEEEPIRSACVEASSIELGFRGVDEALSDLRRTCTNEPVTVGQLVHAAADVAASADCSERTKALAEMLLEDAIHVKRATLDVIATRSLQPSQRLARINRAANRLAKMRTRLDGLLAEVCVSPPPASFLVLIELRADCVVDGAYYQSAYQCPR